MLNQVLLWVGFNAAVLALLILDLGVFHRKARDIRIREALIWTAVWISLALLFDLGIYLVSGPDRALKFLTGYLIEWSLSVDNLFVFLLVFIYFRVPSVLRHRVLFWGIIVAVLLRVVFILAGITLVQRFHWTIYLFGAFLILTGIRMAFQKDKEVHPEKNLVIRFFRRFFPVTGHYEEGKFFAKSNGRYHATPLFIVLMVINTMDVMFAVDSIPAILAITLDPFIVYSSNVFAILGLRALYFALAGIMQLFHYLHYGLSAILVFVGAKMMLADLYKIPVTIALGVVGGILVISVLASIIHPQKAVAGPGPADPLEEGEVGPATARREDPE